MKKEHSVFITLTNDEIAALLHLTFKRKGWLKDVPNWIASVPLDDGEVSFEFKWDGEIK